MIIELCVNVQCKKDKKGRNALTMVPYNYKIKQTIGLSKLGDVRKMLNIDHKGKLPSRIAVAYN